MVFSHTGAEIELPDGIYSVKFATGLQWKGIQVKRGETTTVAGGLVKIEPKVDGVYKIADIETGEEIQQLFGVPSNEQILPPGQYQLMVRGKSAPFTISVGETAVVPIGILHLQGPWKGQIVLKDDQGKRLDFFFDNGGGARFGLLPGQYKVEFEKTDYDITINPGDTAEFKVE